MIRLGGPVFLGETDKAAGAGESHGTDVTDPELLAWKHKEKGYRAAYAPNIRLEDADMVRAVRKAFEAADVTIAEVGYWKNPLHLDPPQRAARRDEMLEALALAEELGACCAVSNLGSYVSEIVKYHDARNFADEAFDAAVENARYVIDTVKPTRTWFSYEMFPFNVIDTPEGVRRLIDAVDRERFGVHMDLVNLVVGAREYYRSGQIVQRCVELFGHRIASAHAKDVALEMPSISVILREVCPGTGNLDYAAYLRALGSLPHEVPLMMEHLHSEAEYDQADRYIREVAAREGVAL